MIRVVPHPEALRERAAELEIIARRLRAAADGDWPTSVPSALLEDWSIGTRAIEVVVGTRVASGKHHISSPLLVLDEERGIAMSMHQAYRLGTRKDPS